MRNAQYRLVLALIAALVAVLAIAPTGASAKGKRELTVMTQNLYLGSSLAPALEAQTLEQFIEGVARIYATVQYTNFPARAKAIAAEIQEKEPDLIGLQEVTKWTTEGFNPPPGYDFLEILQSDLTELGLHYEVAAVSHNANIGPAPLVGSESSCPVLEGGKITCGVTLEDRDVILVNEDTPGLTWSNAQSGRYATQQTVPSPVGPLSFDRGWASIEAKLKNQPFRVVDTHLETEESPADKKRRRPNSSPARAMAGRSSPPATSTPPRTARRPAPTRCSPRPNSSVTPGTKPCSAPVCPAARNRTSRRWRRGR